ncbi:MAG: hypothetical protein ABR502_10420 [Chitinophagaceae bacterium]
MNGYSNEKHVKKGLIFVGSIKEVFCHCKYLQYNSVTSEILFSSLTILDWDYSYFKIIFMKEHTISRVAIYILAIVMIVFGVNHFYNPQSFLIYVPSYLPGGIAWVYIAGVAFILAAIAFIIKKAVKIAGYSLAAMLFIFVLTIHLPNYLYSGETEMRQLAFVNLLKDAALAAFALHIASNARSVD